eukprot:2417067-Rhodomonas_salina.1
MSPLSPRNMSRARSQSKSKSPSNGSCLPRGTGRGIVNLLTTAAVSLFGSSPPTATTDSSELSNPLSSILPSNIPLLSLSSSGNAGIAGAAMRDSSEEPAALPHIPSTPKHSSTART